MQRNNKFDAVILANGDYPTAEIPLEILKNGLITMVIHITLKLFFRFSIVQLTKKPNSKTLNMLILL